MLTFNPKGRSLGRLSEAGEGIELQVGRHGLDKAHGHSAFALAKRSGSYTKHTKKQNFIWNVLCIVIYIHILKQEAGIELMHGADPL